MSEGVRQLPPLQARTETGLGTGREIEIEIAEADSNRTVAMASPNAISAISQPLGSAIQVVGAERVKRAELAAGPPPLSAPQALLWVNGADQAHNATLAQPRIEAEVARALTPLPTVFATPLATQLRTPLPTPQPTAWPQPSASPIATQPVDAPQVGTANFSLDGAVGVLVGLLLLAVGYAVLRYRRLAQRPPSSEVMALQGYDPLPASPPLMGVLHAAPLIYEYESDEGEVQRSPLEVLDFEAEREALGRCFTAANRAVQVQMLTGTPAHLQTLLTLGCRVLHYSGHGHPQFLALEGLNGLAYPITHEKLQGLIAGTNNDALQLAFVSACHSQPAGQAFVAAGVRHVVAITVDDYVLDRAAMRFSEQFYLALLNRRSVQQAFESALQRVRNDPELNGWQVADQEQRKFLLLPEGADHSAVIFGDVAAGAWQLQLPFSPGHVPPSSNRLIGRAEDVQRVLALLASSRWVNITGVAGIGKSTVAREVARYLRQRQAFADGVFCYDLRGLITCESLRRQIAKDVAGVADAGVADLRRVLRGKRVLLLLEHGEDLLSKTGRLFRDFLAELLEADVGVRLLLACSQPVGNVHGVAEQVYALRPLDAAASVELFIERVPEPQRTALREDYAGQSRRHRLGQSPMFRFLAGHPNALCIAAGALHGQRLAELADEIEQMKDAALVDRSIPAEERDVYTSLTASLDLSVAQLRHLEPSPLPLFGLMGLLPGGVLAQDLDVIWGKREVAWPKLMDALLQRNLVERVAAAVDEQRVGQVHYRTLPFVTSYAERLLSPAWRKELSDLIVRYFARLTRQMCRERAQGKLDPQWVEATLNLHETNILACRQPARIASGQPLGELDFYYEQLRVRGEG